MARWYLFLYFSALFFSFSRGQAYPSLAPGNILAGPFSLASCHVPVFCGGSTWSGVAGGIPRAARTVPISCFSFYLIGGITSLRSWIFILTSCTVLPMSANTLELKNSCCSVLLSGVGSILISIFHFLWVRMNSLLVKMVPKNLIYGVLIAHFLLLNTNPCSRDTLIKLWTLASCSTSLRPNTATLLV